MALKSALAKPLATWIAAQIRGHANRAVAEQGHAMRLTPLHQRLAAVAFFLEIGAAEFDRTFEFALELQVELAAFGHEVASDVITFGGFSGHGLWGILAARRTAASIIAAP